MSAGRRWYLVGLGRPPRRLAHVPRRPHAEAWRHRPCASRPRELPAEDAAAFVLAAHDAAAARHELTVRMTVDLERVREHFGPWAATAVQGPGDTVDWTVTGGSVPELLMALPWIPADVPWRLLCSEEVAEAVRGFRDRLGDALDGPSAPRLRGTGGGGGGNQPLESWA